MTAFSRKKQRVYPQFRQSCLPLSYRCRPRQTRSPSSASQISHAFCWISASNLSRRPARIAKCGQARFRGLSPCAIASRTSRVAVIENTPSTFSVEAVIVVFRRNAGQTPGRLRRDHRKRLCAALVAGLASMSSCARTSPKDTFRGRLVDDKPHRAFRRMGTHEHHGMIEPRITHAGHGDQTACRLRFRGFGAIGCRSWVNSKPPSRSESALPQWRHVVTISILFL